MADNTRVAVALTGDDVATDEITGGGVASGAKVQRVKVGFGTDANYADASAGVGLPVEQVCSAAALTNVTASATSVTLLAANANRTGVLLWNNSTATLYLKYGATASATSCTVPIGPGGYWEMPLPAYPLIIDGIWSAANGAARITELS